MDVGLIIGACVISVVTLGSGVLVAGVIVGIVFGGAFGALSAAISGGNVMQGAILELLLVSLLTYQTEDCYEKNEYCTGRHWYNHCLVL